MSFKRRTCLIAALGIAIGACSYVYVMEYKRVIRLAMLAPEEDSISANGDLDRVEETIRMHAALSSLDYRLVFDGGHLNIEIDKPVGMTVRLPLAQGDFIVKVNDKLVPFEETPTDREEAETVSTSVYKIVRVVRRQSELPELSSGDMIEVFWNFGMQESKVLRVQFRGNPPH